MICIASRTGVIARSNRSDLPAMIPSGMPTSSERDTAAIISASVWMLSSHRPLSANVAKATIAQIAAFGPPNRSDTRTPTTAVPIQVIQPQNLISQDTRSSRNDAKLLNAWMTTLGSSALRWSTSQV